MFEKNDMKKEEERVNHEVMRRGMEEQCAMLFSRWRLLVYNFTEGSPGPAGTVKGTNSTDIYHMCNI